MYVNKTFVIFPFDDYFLDEIIPYTNGVFALLFESRTTEGPRGMAVDNRTLSRSEPLPPRVIYNGNTADGSLFTMVRTPYQPFQMPIESSARSYIKNTAGNIVLFSFSNDTLVLFFVNYRIKFLDLS